VLNIFILSPTETRQRAFDGYQVQQIPIRTMAGDKPEHELYEEESLKSSTQWKHAPSSTKGILASYIC
jgi:hypothetical protein